MSSKLIDALEEVESILSTWIDHLPPVVMEKAQEAIEKANAALNEPLRNCDIGTAEEQYERFRDMCFNTNCEGLVKHNTLSEYAFKWSQMPYEEVKK